MAIQKITNWFRFQRAKFYAFLQNIKLIGVWNVQVHDAKTGVLLREQLIYNLIPTVGLNALRDQFAVTPPYTYNIGQDLYVAVGDDATAPNVTDAVLGNETNRKAIGSRSGPSAGVASIVVFFAATEATGNHKEAGLFGSAQSTQATGTVDTGILISHVSFTENVSAAETLTLTFELTFA